MNHLNQKFRELIPTLTLEQKCQICYQAKEIADRWWVDKLDCSVSFARQLIEMDFETIMSKLNEKALFSIIHRNYIDCENYIEVGFRTFENDSPDYFLWICFDLDKLPEILPDLF